MNPYAPLNLPSYSSPNKKKKKRRKKKKKQSAKPLIEQFLFKVDFPTDLYLHIFSFLDHVDLCVLERVCKSLYQFQSRNGQKLWHYLCISRGFISDHKISETLSKLNKAKSKCAKTKFNLHMCTSFKKQKLKSLLNVAEKRVAEHEELLEYYKNLKIGVGEDFKKHFKTHELELLNYCARHYHLTRELEKNVDYFMKYMTDFKNKHPLVIHEQLSGFSFHDMIKYLRSKRERYISSLEEMKKISIDYFLNKFPIVTQFRVRIMSASNGDAYLCFYDQRNMQKLILFNGVSFSKNAISSKLKAKDFNCFEIIPLNYSLKSKEEEIQYFIYADDTFVNIMVSSNIPLNCEIIIDKFFKVPNNAYVNAWQYFCAIAKQWVI